MKEEARRTEEYAKDPHYEAAVSQANALLEGLAGTPEPPGKPVVFIAGLPRSGTTLLYQVLAASGGFGYCSNLIARFYESPALGALVQRLTAPWLPQEAPTFSSRAGATAGWSQPHEFGYFWERHFPFADHHQPDLETLDLGRLSSKLGELEAVLGRPLLFKNVILTFVLARLARELPTMRVVRIRRPLLDVALSISNVRRAYFGNVNAWFSVRPLEGAALLEAEASEQIAYQIARVEGGLETARAALPTDRWLEVEYSSLCSAPRAMTAEVAEFACLDAATLDFESIPKAFAPRPRPPRNSDSAKPYERALLHQGLDPGGHSG